MNAGAACTACAAGVTGVWMGGRDERVGDGDGGGVADHVAERGLVVGGTQLPRKGGPIVVGGPVGDGALVRDRGCRAAGGLGDRALLRRRR